MKKMLMALGAAGAVFASTAAMAGDAEAGKSLFASNCVGCHGANGEGGVGPMLHGQSDKDIKAKLHEYKAGKERGPMTAMMASMAEQLSDEDIENVAAYIATLK